MTTKALGYLFMVLTFLHLPVFLFYNQGNAAQVLGSSKATDLFAKLSIGNIGQSMTACSETNVLFNETLTFSCSFGVLQNLDAWGLPKNDNSTCKNLKKTEVVEDVQALMWEKCSIGQEMFESTDIEDKFKAYFAFKCQG
jgi:hypothetical protein